MESLIFYDGFAMGLLKPDLAVTPSFPTSVNWSRFMDYVAALKELLKRANNIQESLDCIKPQELKSQFFTLINEYIGLLKKLSVEFPWANEDLRSESELHVALIILSAFKMEFVTQQEAHYFEDMCHLSRELKSVFEKGYKAISDLLLAANESEHLSESA